MGELTIAFGEAVTSLAIMVLIARLNVRWGSPKRVGELEFSIGCWVFGFLAFVLMVLMVLALFAPLAQSLEDAEAVCKGLDELRHTVGHLRIACNSTALYQRI